MMPRYIDIDETVKTVEKMHGNESTLINCYNADWIVSFLESQPTADVQEVVRCKDCLHRDPEDKKCDCSFQARGGIFPMEDDDFCNYGERRKDNAEIH